MYMNKLYVLRVLIYYFFYLFSLLFFFSLSHGAALNGNLFKIIIITVFIMISAMRTNSMALFVSPFLVVFVATFLPMLRFFPVFRFMSLLAFVTCKRPAGMVCGKAENDGKVSTQLQLNENAHKMRATNTTQSPLSYLFHHRDGNLSCRDLSFRPSLLRDNPFCVLS